MAPAQGRNPILHCISVSLFLAKLSDHSSEDRTTGCVYFNSEDWVELAELIKV